MRVQVRNNLARPVSLAISNGRLYWADRALNKIFSSSLSDAVDSVPTVEVEHIEDLVDLALFDVSSQPQPRLFLHIIHTRSCEL